MATKTRNDLVIAALGNLGVLAAGQTPSAEDFAAVDKNVDGIIALLDARQVVTIDDLSNIPLELFSPLAILLADDSALAFGLPGVPATPTEPDPVAASYNIIREVTYGRPTGEPQRTEYF